MVLDDLGRRVTVLRWVCCGVVVDGLLRRVGVSGARRRADASRDSGVLRLR